MGNTIQWTNLYPLYNAIVFPNTYPLHTDLCRGYRYPTFEQLWPDASKKVVIGVGVQGKV